MRAPFSGILNITQPFGGNLNREARWVPWGDGQLWVMGHTGIDFSCPVGTPILAVWPGVVTHGYEDSGFGNYLILTVPDGRRALYGHLSEYATAVGATVGPGTRIALSGNSGNSTGPHLHLEVQPAHPNPRNGYRGCEDFIAGFDAQVQPFLNLKNF